MPGQTDAAVSPKEKNGLKNRSHTITGSEFLDDGETIPASGDQSPDPESERKCDKQVIRYCDSVDPEPDILIDTLALQERYRFFEEFKERAMEPKRFEMTPPRDSDSHHRSASPATAPARDPNVVRCSDVVDDIPKTDTTKKMLSVFKQLEQSQLSNGNGTGNGTSSRPEPKPLKRITPPRDLDVVAGVGRSQSLVVNGGKGIEEQEQHQQQHESEEKEAEIGESISRIYCLFTPHSHSSHIY